MLGKQAHQITKVFVTVVLGLSCLDTTIVETASGNEVLGKHWWFSERGYHHSSGPIVEPPAVLFKCEKTTNRPPHYYRPIFWIFWFFMRFFLGGEHWRTLFQDNKMKHVFLENKNLKKKVFLKPICWGGPIKFFLDFVINCSSIDIYIYFFEVFPGIRKIQFFYDKFLLDIIKELFMVRKNELIFIICWGLDLGNSLE